MDINFSTFHQCMDDIELLTVQAETNTEALTRLLSTMNNAVAFFEANKLRLNNNVKNILTKAIKSLSKIDKNNPPIVKLYTSRLEKLVKDVELSLAKEDALKGVSVAVEAFGANH